MSSCLGLFIQDNLIKYAKVSKDHDIVKVESFGVRFYDKLEQEIQQIIQETYSQRLPISVNLSEEMYNYFDLFALLTKKDLQKVIKTEFEALCVEKDYNPNVFETRYAVTESQLEKEKIKVIHVAENKIELNKRIQQIEGYRLTNISPISMSITNLLSTDKITNSLIVNIEDNTTITTIINSKINDIKIIEEGSKDILSRINIKENSYSKAYEICKNTTIYTSEGRELQTEDVGYLDDVMPTLFSVVGEIRNILNQTPEKIDKVYITGTGSLINNVDLYFQEYFSDVQCEILKPYFLQSTGEISIKDYIEVNSAISLALMGLGEGIEGMNFKKQTLSDKVPDWLRIEVKSGKTNPNKKAKSGFITWDLGQKLDKVETNLIRTAVGVLLLVIIYCGFSGALAKQIKDKLEETQESISNTNKQIALAKADDEKINSKINEYTNMITKLQDANEQLAQRARTRNAIPNLLNQVMSVIPQGVQLTSIENTSSTHIVINARSRLYDQLGYFVSRIRNDVILTNVISTAGQKDSSVISVRIEGELP